LPQYIVFVVYVSPARMGDLVDAVVSNDLSARLMMVSANQVFTSIDQFHR